MEQKVEQVLRKTSRAGNASGTDGFTLLELVCVIAIVAILAAIVVPALPRGTSRARLESFAIETAAMLKADRNTAIRNRVQIVTEVDALQRTVRSGASGRVIRVPDDVDPSNDRIEHRVFVAEDKLIALDTMVDKIVGPIERIVGFNILTFQMIQTANRFPLGFSTGTGAAGF